MEKKEESKKVVMPFKIQNFESYDLPECSEILNRLNRLENEQVRREVLNKPLRNIENQINYSMLF
ncbi:hypothetical protein [Adhaeribacter aquaticus]|uniref:hypothetical protein n=1 Tax=Adhaeribacter aquaticus TaxID=299567 RepID=UPI0003FEEEB9|nr:hypothetical protein [Adhaeribacter aquaticus]